MHFKIVFLLLILSSITNSENAMGNPTLDPNLNSKDQEKASDIEEGESTNEDNSNTTTIFPPEFEVEVATLPSPPETPTKPVETKDSEQTPDDKQKPNPDPKPEDKKEEKKEEAKPESKDTPNDQPANEESKKPNETPEKPNEKKEPETPAPKQPEKASRTGLKKGSVWGIAIGVIGMVATTGFLVVYILKRRRGDDRLIR